MFSGQPRNVIKCFETGFKPNLIDCNPEWQIDVFIHTWLNKDQYGQPIHSSAGYYASNPISHNLLDEIYKSYNPISMMVEHPRDFDEKNYRTYKAELIVPKNSISSMYSKLRCYELLYNHLTPIKSIDEYYTLAMSTRLDWRLTEPLILDNFINGHVNVHKDVHPILDDAIQVGMSLGPLNLIIHWCYLYHNFDYYFNKGIIFCDEQLYDAHMKAMNCPVKRNNMPYEILRS